jgi:hypothetical protein
VVRRRRRIRQRRRNKYGPPVKSGFVYFWWVGDAVKVGFSVTPSARILHQTTSNPSYTNLIVVVPGSRRDERRLHQRLKSQHIRAEWFRASRHTLDVIQLEMNAAMRPKPEAVNAEEAAGLAR